MMDKDDALGKIAEDIAACTACALHQMRIKTVPGAGRGNTEIMLIGEGPGRNEDEQGLPFVGASGKFLTQILLKGGFKREDVFITNVVKCRPPQNRDPKTEELQACANFLERQIEVIDPEIIVTLGRFSMARYFENAKIGQIHGKAILVNDRVIVPMYHPAAALHQPRLRSVIENDFAKLPKLIEGAKERRKKKLAHSSLFNEDKQNEPIDQDQPKLF